MNTGETIIGEETANEPPSTSQENIETQTPQETVREEVTSTHEESEKKRLLADKYTSVEELERAYKDLSVKFSAKENSADELNALRDEYAIPEADYSYKPEEFASTQASEIYDEAQKEAKKNRVIR